MSGNSEERTSPPELRDDNVSDLVLFGEAILRRVRQLSESVGEQVQRAVGPSPAPADVPSE